jgi:hypothetical protein
MLFVFLLLYDFNPKKTKKLKSYLLFALIFAGVIVYKAYFMCPYETGKLSWQFAYQSNQQYLQMLDLSFYAKLGTFLVTYYSEVLIAFVLIIFILIKSRKWFKLMLVFGTFFIYLFLICSANTIIHSRYMEQVIYPLVAIAFIPLIYSFPDEPRPGLQNFSVLFISGLIAYRLFIIYSGSELFVARVNQMENIIRSARQFGGSKFIVSESNVDKGYTQLNWSYPIETMLLSSIDGSDLTITVVPGEDIRFSPENRNLAPNQFLFRKWEIKDHIWLNNQYFHLDPGPYRMLCDTNATQDLSQVSRNLRINLKAGRFYRSMDTVWVKATIINKGPYPLRAGNGDRIFLSYFWMQGNEYLDWNGILTPIETDVLHSLSQDVRVAVPLTKGKLMLKVDIVTSERMWMGINASDEVLVY